MAKIKITRENGWIGLYSKFRVIVDGIEVGKVGNAESKIFEISSGKHTIQIKQYFQNSEEISFNLSETESVSFKLAFTDLYKASFPLSLIFLIGYFVADSYMDLSPMAIFILLLPLLFRLSYQYIIGKKPIIIEPG